MSIPVPAQELKAARPASPKHPRFSQAPSSEREVSLPSPQFAMGQPVMARLLSSDTLTHLARQCRADDQRRRKLTCVVFFWLTLLALGPGGPITLHQMITHTLVTLWGLGQTGLESRLSKEALSENFRERPWQFFEAVLRYLLETYALLWQQQANARPAQIVEHLHVLLMDATIMRVANKLFALFPARANRRCQRWAAVKLHIGFRLFRSVPEVVTVAPHKINDHRIDFLRPLGEAVLYIFDLGYWTYALFDKMIERGQHFLSRLREDCNPPILAVRTGDPQWVGRRLKAVSLTGTEVDLVVRLRGNHPTHPQMHHDVRLVGRWHAPTEEWHLYVTSLLDPVAYPVAVLVDLYRLRWQIEIFFRNLKCVLRIANFVSATENGIRIQLYAALIHYVLTHLVILQAMQVTGRRYEDFSVPYCLDAVQQVLRTSDHLIWPGHAPNWEELEVRLVRTVIVNGLRPNRKRQRLITFTKARLQQGSALPAGP